MKKALSLFLMFIMIALLGLGLTSCNGGGQNNNGGDDVSAGIHYSVNVGTKIETLSEEKQLEIGNCVEDCKTFIINGYKESTLPEGVDHYIAITDTFVYDFSSLDEVTEDERVLNMLKSLREDEVCPIMYIEFSGYVSFFGSNYKNIPLFNSGRMVGFFVFEDETFIALNYEKMCANIYYYAMPTNTVCINCGDKYSEELDANALEAYDKVLAHLKEYE